MQSANVLNEIDTNTRNTIVTLGDRLLSETYIKVIKLQVNRDAINAPAKNKLPP